MAAKRDYGVQLMTKLLVFGARTINLHLKKGRRGKTKTKMETACLHSENLSLASLKN